ncbi:hypothetical protein ACSQ8B_20455 [Marinovum sp. F03]
MSSASTPRRRASPPAGLALFSAALALPAGLLLWLTEWLLL